MTSISREDGVTQGLKVLFAAIFLGFLTLSFSHCGSPVEPVSVDPEGSSQMGEQAGEQETSENSSGPIDFSPLAGVYRGGGTHVVFPSGEYWWFTGYGIIRMRYGQMTSITESQFFGQITAGNFPASDFSGSYETEQRLDGAQYLVNSKDSPSLSSLEGRWWGNIQNGDTPNLTFSGEGQISGSSANFRCSFRGEVAPHPEGLNVFAVSLTRTNCLGDGRRTEFVGIALRSGGVLHLLALTPNQNEIFAWEAYR